MDFCQTEVQLQFAKQRFLQTVNIFCKSINSYENGNLNNNFVVAFP